MINGINHTINYTTLNSFSSNPKNKNGYLSYRHHKTRESKRKETIRALSGAIVGTAVPLLFFSKKQNFNPLKIKYGLKELIGVSAGSIIGSVTAGMIGADKFEKKQKVNEGIFQFSNAAIPPTLVAGLDQLTKKVKPLDNKFGKTGSIVVGLLGGMYSAAKLSNFICDPKDKVPDRKLTMKDSIANVDDALGALAITDIPVLNKIISAILPFIYVFCGYRAGASN